MQPSGLGSNRARLLRYWLFDTEFRFVGRKRLGPEIVNKLVFVPGQLTHSNSQSVKNPTSGSDDHEFL